MTILTIVSVLAMALSLSGNIFINFQRRSGFVFWAVSNLLWILANFLGAVNPAQVAMFAIYFVLSIHGFVKWSRTTTNQQQGEPSK